MSTSEPSMAPPAKKERLERVGIVFSGGPAPGANAVIATAASSLLRAGIEVVGFLNGYSALCKEATLTEGSDYRLLENRDLWGLRGQRGILLGTARANPGRPIRSVADLHDPECTRQIEHTCRHLRELGVQGLISIGGDGTLRTANLLSRYQSLSLPPEQHVRVVHVPKTIDNDYRGIDFTFGFFTAVDVMAGEVQNLRADAIATRSYFIVETMGRSTGWLAYGVSVAGEAHMVVAAEDVRGELRKGEHLDVDALCERIVDLIETREARGKPYGIVVLAEGLVELLPPDVVADRVRDSHGFISLSKVDLGKLIASRVGHLYEARTGREKKVTGVQLGYEARSSAPHAFDVMLGCQLGYGAFHALCEDGLDAVMVSVAGQLELRYVPFAEAIDPETLKTGVRFVQSGSDFHRLAHILGTKVD